MTMPMCLCLSAFIKGADDNNNDDQDDVFKEETQLNLCQATPQSVLYSFLQIHLTPFFCFLLIQHNPVCLSINMFIIPFHLYLKEGSYKKKIKNLKKLKIPANQENT